MNHRVASPDREGGLGDGRARPALSGQGGMTLVEALVSVAILGIAVMAVVGVLGSSLIQDRASQRRQAATDAVSSELEEARSLHFSTLAMVTDELSDTDPRLEQAGSGWHVDVDGDGATDESVVTAVDGAISPYITVDGTIEVRTYVSWYDPDGADEQRTKRVTAVGTWTNPGGSAGKVEASTVIADVGGGLDGVAFDVAPPSAEETAELAGDTVCFRHWLSNYGGTDRYDVLVEDWGLTGNTWESNGYEMTAYLGGDHNNGDQFVDSNDDGVPNSPDSVTTGSTVELHFCVDTPDSANPGDEAVLDITVRSAADPDVEEDVEDTVSIGVDDDECVPSGDEDDDDGDDGDDDDGDDDDGDDDDGDDDDGDDDCGDDGDDDGDDDDGDDDDGDDDDCDDDDDDDDDDEEDEECEED